MARLQFGSLFQAMRQAAQIVQQHWQGMVQRLLPTAGTRDAYGRGLGAQEPPVVETPSGLATQVINSAPAAPSIEQGRGAYHLPSRIDWGRTPAARRTRAGRPYLLIPFRHYSAQRGSRAQAGSAAARRNMLARPVYDVARLLRPGQYLTAGPSRGRAVHAPGLHPYVPRLPQNIRPGYTHAAAQERLRRVPGPRSGSGSYLTFRTMTPDAPGWWIPAQPPRPIASEAARTAAPEVRRVLAAAATEDIVAQVRSALKGWAGAH
jgi:hypothetical protein